MSINKFIIRYLCSRGFKEKRAVVYIQKLRNDFKVSRKSLLEKLWSYRKGFFSDKIEKYGLTKYNYKEYISDYSYFKGYPYNNHFEIWINDKLTLRYILEKFSNYMPEYYLYIENDGTKTYLMDVPQNIELNGRFLVNLLDEKKKLACKPSRGAGGLGFVVLEKEDNCYVYNGRRYSLDEFDIICNTKLRGYLVTEFLNCETPMLEKVLGSANISLRIDIVQEPKNVFNVFAAYIQSGNNVTSNVGESGKVVKFDYDSGEIDNRVIVLNETGFREEILVDKFCIPYINEIHILVESITRHIASISYMGMDIVISDKGPKLLEINSHPQIDVVQCLYGPIMYDENVFTFMQKKFNERVNNIVT